MNLKKFKSLLVTHNKALQNSYVGRLFSKLEVKFNSYFQKKDSIISFDQLIKVCGDKKEMKLKYELENNINLVKFENQRIEISFNDNLDKDWYFIGRNFSPIDISDDFVLDLEPQFLIQRSLKGYTKSFVKKDESITSEKVKRNIGFEDYFAVKSQIKGEIYDWDL